MKPLLLLLTALTLLLATACQPIDEISEPQGSLTSGSLLISDLERDIEPDVDPDLWMALARDNSAFALAFYELIQADNDNLIFSPFSLSIALSMTLAGAETTTQQAMIEALRLSLDGEEIHPAFNALMLAIESSQNQDSGSDNGDFQLNMANSIWGQSGFDFKQAFLDTLALNYGAGMHTVNFIEEPEASRLAINDWVAEQTKEKILDLIPSDAITPLTRLVLTNAIYFQGAWLHQFNPEATQPSPFTTLDGEEISVDMMRLSEEYFLYLQGANFQAVRLPYQNSDFAMDIIVPDLGSFTSVEQSLTIPFITDVSENLVSERINLSMPKFDFETVINANQALKSLGMEEAFNPDLSDFTGMADVDDLHISDVLQKATITVDEEGTEAAAATAVIVSRESLPIDEPISLFIDRPFIFMIQHVPTGSILFMGRVLEP